MDGWSGVAIRFAVYATLALAFGVPLQLLAMRRAASRAVLAWPVVGGLAASALGLLALVAAMSGTAMLPVDGETLHVVLVETPLGTAFVVRFLALAAALAVAVSPGIGGRLRLIGVAAGTGVALATLAWAGHGAMDEGWRGSIHLAADILHLLAAGAWIGAIAAMLDAVVRRRPDAREALARFARTGSVLVALLVVTGLVNGAMILGADALPTLGATLYGRILLAKLALFAAMLGLAALNRWVLTPRNEPGALRTSLSVELATGFAVLALVAWLGTLSPDG